MTPLALALVLVAAFAHAGWNALSKRAPGGAAFVWTQKLVGSVCLVPVAAAGIWLDDGARVSLAIVLMGIASGCTHTVYFVLLQRGYGRGDLSLVYPLARGTGPIFATAGAIALLGERPGPLALAGTAAIAAGVVLLLATRGIRRGPALVYAVLTGLLIGIYTIWDGHAVRASNAEPLFYLLITNLTIVVALLPNALRERATVGLLLRDYRGVVVAVGLLSPFAYALVLFATRLAGVAYVAPAREVSILIGAVDRHALLRRARRLAAPRGRGGDRRRRDRARARLKAARWGSDPTCGACAWGLAPMRRARASGRGRRSRARPRRPRGRPCCARAR